MINNPYQTAPMMNNNYMPQYGAYNYNPMANMQKYQSQEQIQQPQVQQTMPQQIIGINGRIVQALENINANEVPMDGSMAFFPKQDLSEIYVKGWNANGRIKTIVYKPYTESDGNNVSSPTTDIENTKFTLSDESTQLFLNKFEELSEKIGQLEDRFDKSLGTQRKTSRTQSKGGDGDE